MKRIVLVSTGLLAILLAACTPTSQVAFNVVPQLISAGPVNAQGEVVLQGRYFGGGGEGSYVLVGADQDRRGGVQVETSNWSPTRIVFVAPPNVGPGFVFVVVQGRFSTGLPLNLP